MPDFFMLSNPANPYSTRLSDDSPIYNTHLICRRAIFDEASSNLDVETAENIGRTVGRLKGGMSVLFIAHQLPASLQVDRIFSLNGATA